MATKGGAAPTATRAGLQRLAAGTRPPPSALRANQTGPDRRAKNAAGMKLVDEHSGSTTLRTKFLQIVGAEPGDGRALAQGSGVKQWADARQHVITQGREDGLSEHDRPVVRLLAPIDTQYRAAVQARLGDMRAGLDQREVDYPVVPPLGEEAGLPPPERATQLAVVRERVSEDFGQYEEHGALAVRTNDFVLGSELVSVGRRNTLPGGPWFQGAVYDKVQRLIDGLQEFFRTPKVAAGEANAVLTELQRADLDALERELNNPAVAERLPMLLFNRTFRWLQAPDPAPDAADRFDELAALAARVEPALRQLDASGERLIAAEGEDLLPIQLTGDRGGTQI